MKRWRSESDGELIFRGFISSVGRGREGRVKGGVLGIRLFCFAAIGSEVMVLPSCDG